MNPPASQRHILICATARSGSTLLYRALAGSAGEEGSSEHFCPTTFYDLVPSAGAGLGTVGGVAEEVAQVVDAHRSERGTYVAKFMWGHLCFLGERAGLERPPGIEELERWFPDAELVFLTRRDQVAQAISGVKALRSGVFHRKADGEGETGGSNAGEYDFYQIGEGLRVMKMDEEGWKGWLDSLGRPYVEVFYEDLLEDYGGVVGGLIDRLNLREEFPETPGPLLARTTDSTNAEWGARFREDSGKATIEALTESGRSAEIAFSEPPPEEVEMTSEFTVGVTVTNRSGATWPGAGIPGGDGWVVVAARWMSGGDDLDFPVINDALRVPIKPEESGEVALQLTAPSSPGHCELAFRVRQIGVGGFDLGSEERVVKVPVKVLPPAGSEEAAEFFGGLTHLVAGWYDTPWFGRLTVEKFPWVHHSEMGWIWLDLQPRDSGILFAFPAGRWYLTEEETYPSLRCMETGEDVSLATAIARHEAGTASS